MTEKNTIRLGVALGSGGIKGLAHIGVLEVLREAGYRVAALSGSSIGAWIAAHYALFQDLERLTELTVGQREKKLFSMAEFSLNGGLIRGDKVRLMFAEWLNNKGFADLTIPVRVVTTDLVSGEEVWLEDGPLADAVQASTAIPSFFAPVSMEGRLLVDGGVADPVPVRALMGMGVDLILAVNLLNYRLPGIFLTDDAHSIARATGRAFDLSQHYHAIACSAGADLVIEPANAYSELESWSHYFTHDIGSTHVELGRKAMLEKLPELERLITHRVQESD